MKIIMSVVAIAILFAAGCVSNTYPSSFAYKGVTVKWLGHSGFEISGQKKIYIDPFKINFTDNADFILLTHEHFDHCDIESVKKLQSKDTAIYGTFNCIKQLSGKANTLRPGEETRYPDGIVIAAVQAYNLNNSYHTKNSGRGFIVTVSNLTIYHAGDTDLIPEMQDIKNIDIALLPIGGKYTMSVEEAAEAARMINPKIAVPMHYNSDKFNITDIKAEPQRLKDLLKGAIEVKILSA